jgi:3-oxoadipate CoA-transferase, alpha subunit
LNQQEKIMINKVNNRFLEAVQDIPDGASVALHNWGYAGAPQNLIRALREHGAKDLTIITENFFYVPIPEEMQVSCQALMPQIKKVITGFYASSSRYAENLPKEYTDAESRLEIDVPGHGNFANMLRAAAAGTGPFYSQVGIGTVIEEGREKRVFDGEVYLLFHPLKPDYALVRAHKADRYGNLSYNGINRSGNPNFAAAAKTVIVEVDEIVEAGELHHDQIITPAPFVDRIVGIEKCGKGSYEDLMNGFMGMMSIEEIRQSVFAKSKNLMGKKEEKQ